MKKSSKMFANLSLKSSMVVPLPTQTLFNQHLTSNLKTLLSSSSLSSSSLLERQPSSNDYVTISFLSHALDALVATQKLSHEFLSKSTFTGSDREAIERYLETNNIDLLDACNSLGDKLDNVNEYVKSLRLALHCLEGRSPPTLTSISRANKILQSMEGEEGRKKTKFISSIPSFKKLSDKIVQHRMNYRATKNRYDNVVRSEVEEILEGSSVVTSTICEILESSLSFKLKHGLHNTISGSTAPYSSYSWLSSLQELRNKSKKSLQVGELQKTVWLVQELRQELRCQDCSKVRVRVEELKRSCDELENGVKALEGKVKEVYRFLMCVRMGLLGKLSSMA